MLLTVFDRHPPVLCKLIGALSTTNGRRETWQLQRLRGRPDGLPILSPIQPRLFPQPAGDFDRFDAGGLPPCALVTHPVNRAVMHAAERHRELIAHLAAERPPLREAQMMRVGGLAAADQAGQLGHEPQMLFVAIAFWLGQREGAVYPGG